MPRERFAGKSAFPLGGEYRVGLCVTAIQLRILVVDLLVKVDLYSKTPVITIFPL